MMTDVQAALPPDLRGPDTTVVPISGGLSGAGVWRVEAPGQPPLALKIWSAAEPLARWRRALRVVERAAEAGLAPRVVHRDEALRAVVSEFVTQPFVAFYGNPATRAAALVLLAQALRRVHALPIDAIGESAPEPRTLLADEWLPVEAAAEVPSFICATVERSLALEAPPLERARVLSHNDANPGNIVVDGERLLLVDWDHAGPNDPYYDLATVAVFLGMDEDACARLLATYDDAPLSPLPARFQYVRQLIATLGGVRFLGMAFAKGDIRAGLPSSLEEALPLIEFYQRLRTGAVSLATAEGLSLFGLALLRQGVQQRLP